MRYRYRSEEELKDSGVEWLGSIPKNWEVKRNRHIIDFRRREVNEYEDTTVLSLTVKGVKVKKDLSFGKSTESYIGHQLVYPGDIVFTPRDFDQTPILSGVSDYFGCISNLYFVLKCKNDINNYFVDYFWWGLKYKVDFFKNFSYGIRYGYNYDQFKDLLFLKPNYVEQEKIANFLDEKTSQFDLIISKKEKLIERLEEAKKSLISEVVIGKVKVVKNDDGYKLIKRSSEELKESGVEWLGQIPKDWEVKRIKQISSVISKGTTPSTVGKEIIDSGEIRFLKAENIYEGRISLTPEFFIDEETNNILKRSELKENDILFVIAGATIGKVAIVQKEHCPANTNQAISFIRLYNDINCKFVYYWLSSSKLQENMWLYAVQSAQPNLSMENLGNFHIPYPSEEEIYILTNYIENKGVEISNIIDNIKKQIEKLKEAKQSLISEVVTGKIEILD